MESFGESMNSYLSEPRESEDPSRNPVEIKVAELFKTKEDLKKAKDGATQSWLDSKPLIDKLDKLQRDLANEKERGTKSKTIILELESQLENARNSIQSRKEEEIKLRAMIDQINQSSEKIRAEMEQLKLETVEERRAKSKLKQVLWLRKHKLRALHLTLRAIRMESEAFGASSAQALHHINCSQTEYATVQLTKEEYDALMTSAHEANSLADWRVSLSVEQQLKAEESRELVRRRLHVQQTDNRTRKKKTEDEVIANTISIQAEDSRIEGADQVNNRSKTSPKARAKVISRRNSQQIKRSNRNTKRTVKQKKPSMFVQIRTFCMRKITLWFR